MTKTKVTQNYLYTRGSMDGNETKHSVWYMLEETWLTKAPQQNHKTTEKIHYKDPATKHSQRSFIQVTELRVGEVDLHIHWQVISMLYLFFFE